MKNCIILILTLLLAGCVTSAVHVTPTKEYPVFTLKEDYRDTWKFRLTKHDRTFPAGTYRVTFEGHGGFYYQSEKGTYIDHLQKDKIVDGGIFISYDKATLRTFAIVEDVNSVAFGGGAVGYAIASALAPKKGTPLPFAKLTVEFLNNIEWN